MYFIYHSCVLHPTALITQVFGVHLVTAHYHLLQQNLPNYTEFLTLMHYICNMLRLIKMNKKNCGTINRESMVVYKQHSDPQSIINYGAVQPSGN